jgi:hypothetical protein
VGAVNLGIVGDGLERDAPRCLALQAIAYPCDTLTRPSATLTRPSATLTQWEREQG